jgi:hypothetical protein
MDFQSEYEKLTKTIDDTLTTQTSSSLSWKNLPGSLIKVMSSAGGYAWGFSEAGELYNCTMPCNGDWKKVDLSKYQLMRVYDFALDTVNVYALAIDNKGKEVLLICSVSNKGDWNIIPINTGDRSYQRMFSTHTYIWLDSDGGAGFKYKCAKPCTTGNWIQIPKDGIRITSSSETALYGVDSSGNPVKTDENISTGWSTIKAFANKSKWLGITGQEGNAGTYGVDTNHKVYNCEGSCETPDDMKPVNTKGFVPSYLSYDPESKYLWMTTSKNGEKGNIFSRLDKADYSSILNSIDPIDNKRDDIVKDVSKEYEVQTKSLTMNKQLQVVVDFFSKFFGYNKSVGQDNTNQSSVLTQNIEKSQQEIDKMTSISSKILTLIITLSVVVMIYVLAEPILGTYVHFITTIALLIGIFFTAYY